MTMIDKLRKPAHINGIALIIGPDVEWDGIPHEENLDWIRQYCKASPGKYYIIEGDETFPVRIWEGLSNDVDMLFECVYEQDD